MTIEAVPDWIIERLESLKEYFYKNQANQKSQEANDEENHGKYVG